MMDMSSIASLNTTLKPLQVFLQQADVAELSINRPNEVWIDNSRGWRGYSIDMPLKKCLRLAELIAAHSQQVVSREQPLLSAFLPAGYRVQAVLPPATLWLDEKAPPSEAVSLSIRKPTSAPIGLEEYADCGGFAQIGKARGVSCDVQAQLTSLLLKQDFAAALSLAVNAHLTILISGATYAGKTYFLNMLARLVDDGERIITLEDNTPEILLTHPNRVRLFYSRHRQGQAQVTADDLVNATLRMRPDRILMGELRGDDAHPWLLALNSGHEGSMTTIHADSPRLAVEKLVRMVKTREPYQSDDAIRQYILSLIDIIVQLKHDPIQHQRYCSEVCLASEVATPCRHPSRTNNMDAGITNEEKKHEKTIS